MKMKLYMCIARATRPLSNGVSNADVQATLIAQNDEEAYSTALEHAYKKLPESQRWEGHNVTIQEIDQDIIYRYPATGEQFRIRLFPLT